MGFKKPLPLVKVIFFLGSNQWHGYETESIWAEKITHNRCRLRNSPFYAKGVSFEDIVFVQKKGSDYIFESVSIAAGHSTYRIILEKYKLENDFSNYWNSLEKLGCSYEEAEKEKVHLFAIDVPPNSDIHKVYELLSEGERAEVWAFEEGHCGHNI